MIAYVEVTAANFERYCSEICRLEETAFRTPWSEAAYRQELDNPVSRLWVLLEGGSFAGYACFWIFAQELHIMKIALLAPMRGRGLASKLMERIVAEGGAAGARSAWLEVRPSNAAALRLYARQGFEEVGRRRSYYSDSGEDAVLMSRSILQYSASGEL
ncbi:Ribosomal-protein-alanine acetyltransferase [uncultured Desulfatiglans sp.]|uniref:Ribosomal-protein-alanine acetyltransferase n=1 Tax=Uncultured Desulfatiglans sp. TaxID=1748965 RepID=A0A653A1P6_UNCDX|nr:Ribosomal-protein-alanine acetyltransferase [uncultured Desulfatiglans sp.]